MIAILIILMFLIISVWGVTKFTKQAWSMYEDADKLEEEIKRGESIEIIYPKFLTIHKKAFEQHTFGRVRELAKMIEIKYNIEVIKK